MKKIKNKNEHPEVKEIKNICEISPHTKSTQDVCDKLQNEKEYKPNNKSKH